VVRGGGSSGGGDGCGGSGGYGVCDGGGGGCAFAVLTVLSRATNRIRWFVMFFSK